jgi:hypothetical protein
MHYRLLYRAKSYEGGHYLNIKKLNKLERLEMKQIFKDVGKMQKFTEKLVQGAIKNE